MKKFAVPAAVLVAAPMTVGASSANAVEVSSSAGIHTQSTSTRILSAKERAVLAIRPPHKYASVAYNKYWAREYMRIKYGWGKSQFKAFDRVVTRESGWDERAMNRSSGAYGIPQSLPASKMRSAGKDWRTNPRTQIKWACSYMKSAYGSPSKAWNFWASHHWY